VISIIKYFLFVAANISNYSLFGSVFVNIYKSGRFLSLHVMYEGEILQLLYNSMRIHYDTHIFDFNTSAAFINIQRTSHILNQTITTI